MLLNLKEMEDLNVLHTGIQGLAKKDIESFNVIQERISSLKPGESLEIEERKISGGAMVGGTLGRFTIIIDGTITKDERDPEKWLFTGEMRYLDEWNFVDEEKDDQGDLERSAWGEFQTRVGRKYLKGQSFLILTPSVKISQSSKDDYFDWFEGKSTKTVKNKFAGDKIGIEEIKNIDSEIR